MNEQTLKKKAWIDFLYYEVGKQSHNFRLCSTWKDKNGEICFSKWRYYLDIQDDSNFVTRCNQREQLKNEVILDLDEGDFNALIERLKKDKIDFCAYQTKSGRARHIHTYWYKMISYPKYFREKIKEKVIEEYGGDTAFKIDAHMIPLENAIHWKTGEMKELVCKNGDIFNE